MKYYIVIFIYVQKKLISHRKIVKINHRVGKKPVFFVINRKNPFFWFKPVFFSVFMVFSVFVYFFEKELYLYFIIPHVLFPTYEFNNGFIL